jgi:hypothetical protein
VSAFTKKENSAIFKTDNDFEVYLSSDPFAHKNLIEFEINALNTTWSLLLPRPYG